MKINIIINKIDELTKKVDILQHKIQKLSNDCNELTQENQKLSNDKETVNIKIQGYIKELEKIREHYANTIDNRSES